MPVISPRRLARRWICLMLMLLGSIAFAGARGSVHANPPLQPPPDTPTPTPGPMLTIPSTYTNPMPVVAGDSFDLFVVLRNVAAVELESIVVTYLIEASSGLILADTSNVVSVPWLSPGSQATVSIHLRSASSVSGVRLVPIQVDYSYWDGAIRRSGSARTNAFIEVVAPTATPSPTSTPTPTNTPTVTLTPTPTDTSTLTPAPMPTPDETREALLRPTQESADQGSPQADVPSELPQESTVGRQALVLLESYEPVWVEPGARNSFMLTLTLSNEGGAPATNITVKLTSPDFIRTGGDNQGKGQVWFFTDRLVPGQPMSVPTSYTFIGQGDGVYTIPVTIGYRDSLGVERTQEDRITLVVDVWPPRFPSPTPSAVLTARAVSPAPASTPTVAAMFPGPTPAATPTEAWWLSLLRAIFGVQESP